MLEEIKRSIRATVSDDHIGIAFSGGVDSTLVAKVCSMMGYEIELITVGFADSHDIRFASKVNEELSLPHHIHEIDPSTFSDVVDSVQNTIQSDDLSWIENSVAFYYMANLAAGLNLHSVVSANGIDELFCGYSMYRETFSKGESYLQQLILSKAHNELEMMEAVNSITKQFDVRILQPLLSKEFIEFANTIPLCEKVTGENDLLRSAIRSLAKEIGAPKISINKRKKSMQYGSQIHKAILRL